jgi:hypothetical protein
MAVHKYHDARKFVTDEKEIEGNVVREVHSCHALATVVAAVIVQAPNETMEVQSYHVELKSVPLDRSSAGKEVRS